MITGIDIRSRSPFVGGAEFGASGAYVRIDGTASGALDPSHPGNRGIALLDRAPRNAQGLVAYRSDFVLLCPAEPVRGNGRLLHEVNNRGRIMLFHYLCSGPVGNNPKSAVDLGNALPLRLGFSLLWSGWDAGAPKATGLSLETPTIEGLTRRIREEFVSGTRLGIHETFRLTHEAANLNASMTVRRTQTAERVPAPFAFVDNRTIRLLPEGTNAEIGSIYEIHYEATNPQVQGIGFAATRDIVAHVRRNGVDLTGRPITHTLAFGISQAGRYLRDHLAQGFNADEDGERVFDGVLTHVAGVGRVFHNTPFAQPFRTRSWHEDHDFPEVEFPFWSGDLMQGDATDPKLIETNTSSEYWQKGASLLHTDPSGEYDCPLPANVRGYLVAGTQHGGRAGMPRDRGPCVNPRNWHDPMPAVRALLVALDEWVVWGRAPPDSRLPSIAGGTLTPHEAAAFPLVPGLTPPKAANDIASLPDWTDPRSAEPKYGPLIPQVDGDGNEQGGILLPDIAVPRGTFTGWNLYAPPYPDGELADRDGAFLTFATTPEARAASGDPRPSLTERYPGSTYADRVAAVVAELRRDRLLLAEDAEAYLARV